MKIVCLIASLRLGGAERQMVGLAGTLSRNGHQVTVLTYRNGDFYGESLAAAGVERLRLKSNSTPDIVSEIAEHIDKSAARVLISFLNGANIKACLVGKRCPDLRVIVSERTTNLHFTPHRIIPLRTVQEMGRQSGMQQFCAGRIHTQTLSAAIRESYDHPQLCRFAKIRAGTR